MMAEIEKTSTPSSRDEVTVEKNATLYPRLGAQEDIGSRYGVDEKALIRKLDYKLLPALTLLYLLSFLDRSNGGPFHLLRDGQR